MQELTLGVKGSAFERFVPTTTKHICVVFIYVNLACHERGVLNSYTDVTEYVLYNLTDPTKLFNEHQNRLPNTRIVREISNGKRFND